MKLNSILGITLATAGLSAISLSCSKDTPIDYNKTVVTNSVEAQTPLDKWLEHNILIPYNIEIRYRMQDNEISKDYHLAPAEYEKSVQMAHLIKYLCLEVYDEATGSQAFVRSMFPKLVDLIGTPAYNTNGTMVLGTAEGGRKMTLYMINSLAPGNVELLNRFYFKTMHHEFGHIQNQTKPYPNDFQMITSSAYVSDSWNNAWNNPMTVKTTIQNELRNRYPLADSLLPYRMERNTLNAKENKSEADVARIAYLETRIPTAQAQARAINRALSYVESATNADLNALRAGFISTYASSQHREDFVEIQSIYMTDAPELWETKLICAGNAGREAIQQKFEIVENYLRNDWGISLSELRDIVRRRQNGIALQNLNDLSVN